MRIRLQGAVVLYDSPAPPLSANVGRQDAVCGAISAGMARLDRRIGERYDPFMRIATGKVIAGKVVVDGVPLEEGTTVTVIADDDAGTFELGPEDEAALLAAIGEANRGEVLNGPELLTELGPRS